MSWRSRGGGLEDLASVSPLYFRITSMRTSHRPEAVTGLRVGTHIAKSDVGRALRNRRVVAAQLFWNATSRYLRSSTRFQRAWPPGRARASA